MELNPCIDEIHCYKGKNGLYNLEIIGISEKNEPLQINVEDVDMSGVQVSARVESSHFITPWGSPAYSRFSNVDLLGDIIVEGLVIKV